MDRGDEVWVHAFNRWRIGTVVTVGPKRVRVEYQSRTGTGWSNSRPEPRVAWFPAANVLPGSLPAPESTSCPECRRKLVDGRPGEAEEQVIARHVTRSHPSTGDGSGSVEPGRQDHSTVGTAVGKAGSAATPLPEATDA